MMWTPALLLLLAGAAFASSGAGYETGKEYNYKIKSRTLASIDSESNQFTGVLIEGRLTLQPNGQNLLRGKISNPRYSQVHTRLEKWDSEISSNQQNMQDLPLSSQPFEIKTKNGVVQDLIVNKNIPTWEVNFLKSVMSQLQADTQAENALESRHNQYPEGSQPFASFKTMEDSVGGKCEVRYDIAPLTEEELQNNPELAPLPKLREDGEILSAVKTKNYSNCDQRPSYNFGVDGRNEWRPSGNDNGNSLSRSSVSRIVLTGNLKSNVIQSSVTTNKVVHGSHSQDQRKQGMVASKMNLTLHEIKDMSEQIQAPSEAESTGNLVFSYSNPMDIEPLRRPNKSNQDRRQRNRNNRNADSTESASNEDSNESRDDSSRSSEDNNDNSYLQPRPSMTEAPQIPMSPLFIGNNGKSIRKSDKIDVVKAAKDIAQRIANAMQNPDTMFEEETLEMFATLSKLVRTMNAEQIAEAQRELYEPQQSRNQLNQNDKSQNSRRKASVAFRDAVALSGTGPALMNIKQWIQNKQIKGQEAANVVDNIARSARIPTSQFTDTFFEMVKMPETKEDAILSKSAVLSFADLMRHVATDKRSSHNRYPVHAFGKFSSKGQKNLEDKYLPYIAEKLKSAIEAGDSENIQTYTTALGKTGHPRMLSILEPYLEGRKQVSQFQRLNMVLSLNKLAETRPHTAQSVLFKTYANTADNQEIRTAAVFLLMKTNPSASLLQRMAEATNFDSSKQVNSAVKSAIQSLAELDESENPNLVRAAKAARPLLTEENYGPQYSKMNIKSYQNPLTKSGISVEANWIGSEDSNVPKAFYLSGSRTFKGVKTPDFEIGASFSSLRSLWNFVEEQLNKNKNQNNNNNQNEQSKKFSAENIAKMLNINGNDAEQVEGIAFLNDNYMNHFASFDNHTIENAKNKAKQMIEDLQNGKNIEETKLNNDEVVISFPTETGFPFRFTIRSPTVKSLEGNTKLESHNDKDQLGLGKQIQQKANVRMVYGMKIQKRLSFVTPFEHQEYIAGVDRTVQLHLPMRAELEVNTEKKETRLKIQAKDGQDFKIIQFKVQPYTAKHDIFNMEPIAKNKNTHIVQKDRATQSHIEMNDKNNKPLLKFSYERVWPFQSENESGENNKDKQAMREAYKFGQSLLSMAYPMKSDAEYQKYSLKVSPSSDLSIEAQVSHESEQSDNQNNNNNDDKSNEKDSSNVKVPNLSESLSKEERKQKMLKEAAKNINAAQANAVDIKVQVTGGLQSWLTLTAAHARSNVDSKSRLLVRAFAKSMNNKEYHMSTKAESKNPKTNAIDFEDILKNNNRRDVEVDIHYGPGNGNDETNKSKVKVQAKLEQTEDRKNEVRQSRDAEKCNRNKNQEGNKMTPACQNARKRASSMDKAEMTVNFENEKALKNLALNLLDLAQKAKNPLDTYKNRQDKGDKDQIKIKATISSDEEKADVTIKTPEGKMQIKNVKVNPLENSNENAKEKKNQENMALASRQSKICNLDKTQTKTFDNRRYSAEQGKCWHVAMTSVPKNDADEPNKQQRIPNNMRVTVLTRENGNGRKELKVTLGALEIELKPTESQSESDRAEAKVNGEKVNIFKNKSHQERENGKVIAEIVKSKDGSVKVISEKYNIKINYDGARAEIKAGDKYRNFVRGLCGNFDGEPENDQQTPKGCTLQKPEEFSATWALTSEEKCEGPARQNAEKAKRSRCAYRSARPGNVISEPEAGRQDPNNNKRRNNNSNNDKENEGQRCTHHRTRITKNDDEICFSKRPVPTCSSSCKPDGMKSKPVEFHCVPRNSASEKIAQRVEKGANPDLSQKKTSKTEAQQVPTSCRA